jgi:hypothetical protein
MNIGPSELLDLFDNVMREPLSARGIDVSETCRLLAERVRALVPPGGI